MVRRPHSVADPAKDGRDSYLLPIIISILILLVIVYFSYRQTIAAYPSGGGSYTVATETWARKQVCLRQRH